MRYAAFAAQLRHGPAPWLLAISGSAFVALSLLQQSPGFAALCGNVALTDLLRLAGTLSMLWSPWRLALDWSLMVAAMMTPLVALQVSHIWRSTVDARKVSATAAFLLTYYFCWLATSAILFVLMLAMPKVPFAWGDVISAVVLASLWSASPFAQAARNRCHMVRRIRAFGPQTYLDSAAQGVSTGSNCVAACWPWMVVPMTIETGHISVMLAVTVYLLAERIAPAAPVGWRVPPAWETLLGPAALRVYKPRRPHHRSKQAMET